jgi:hypothetical protein
MSIWGVKSRRMFALENHQCLFKTELQQHDKQLPALNFLKLPPAIYPLPATSK